MKVSISLTILSCNLIWGLIIPADPFYLTSIEKQNYSINNRYANLIFRPNIDSHNSFWMLRLRKDLFFNNGAQNMENMGNRLIGKGIGSFIGLNFSYINSFLIFSIEPFYYINQNKEYKVLNRPNIFSPLNDVRKRKENPFISYGFRDIQINLHYKDFGFGLSNSNMWWGPGIHTSLTMTNNTSGFPYLIIGTVREKKYKNIGIDIKYIFSELNKTKNNPFYSAIIGAVTLYSNPIITFGLNKNIIASKMNNGLGLTKYDAALILFKNNINFQDSYQTTVAYLIFDFLNPRLKVFFELGTTDKWENMNDFLNYPDHGIGSIFGFRQYGIFNRENLIMGFEYARLIKSSYWDKRPTPNWYGNEIFDYSSYDGRRWAAHSGSDSDDFYFFFGYQGEVFTFMPSLNYERHGILYKRPPEVKMEISLDFRYNWNSYKFNIIFEREWLEHAGFNMNDWRMGSVIWLGIERDLTYLLNNRNKN